MIVELSDVADIEKLAPVGRRVLRHIMDRGAWVSSGDLVDLLYGDRVDGGPSRADWNVRKHISSVRKTLKPGFYISNAYAFGYRLEIEPATLVGVMLQQIPERLAA